MASKVTKRSVTTDALETLGTIIGPEEKRDAIHLAVLPVIAEQKLYPGQSIDQKDGYAYPSDDKSLGIVDPFLKGAIMPDQRFWMILRPRLITSLRHEWTHPAIPNDLGRGGKDPVKEKDEAIAKIEEMAAGIGRTADSLIRAANTYLDHGDYLIGGADMEGESTPDEFWPLFEIVTGRKVPDQNRNNFFSCSC